MIINLFDPRWDTEGQPIPEEWLLGRVRLHRNRLLVQSDWAMMPDAPTNKETWAAYRQALRDFPATWVPSQEVEFPDPPA